MRYSSRERSIQTVTTTTTGALVLFQTVPPFEGTLGVQNMLTQRAHHKVFDYDHRTEVAILEHISFTQIPWVELAQLNECYQVYKSVPRVLLASQSQRNMALVHVILWRQWISMVVKSVVELENFDPVHWQPPEIEEVGVFATILP